MTKQTIYPALRYEDAPAAIAWLERAFALTPEHVYPGEPGAIAHAQLRAGRDLLMLGSPAGEGATRNSSPKAFGGKGTLSLSLRVDDPDAVHARALAAGAGIVLAPHDTEYGSRSFAATDCEGYVWTFGTYAPNAQTDLCAGLRYEDAARAIAWLRDTCGFTEKMVVPGDEGGVAHAEFALGDSVLMFGSRRSDAYGLDTPARAGGRTGGIYVAVIEPDALFARVRDSGVRVIGEPVDMDYGSREFGIEDAEGHSFGFGTYRP